MTNMFFGRAPDHIVDFLLGKKDDAPQAYTTFTYTNYLDFSYDSWDTINVELDVMGSDGNPVTYDGNAYEWTDSNMPG